MEKIICESLFDEEQKRDFKENIFCLAYILKSGISIW